MRDELPEQESGQCCDGLTVGALPLDYQIGSAQKSMRAALLVVNGDPVGDLALLARVEP